MKKLVLLGDSIRDIGYGKPVAEALSDEYEVFQSENGRFAAYTLRGLYEWTFIDGADVVHWNNGLWDICDFYGDGELTPIDYYVDTMVRIAKILKSKCGKVIFATTTPVIEPHPFRKNEAIDRYNEAIVPELKKLDVYINDLNSEVKKDIPLYICEDRTHLSSSGIDLCSGLVVSAIRNADR